jgi:hypothetical protein
LARIAASVDPVFDSGQEPIPLDSNPPEIDFAVVVGGEEPVYGQLPDFVSGSITIVARAVDNEDILQSFELTSPANYNPVPAYPEDNDWTLTLHLDTTGLADGPYAFSFRATDRSGNSHESSLTLMIDNLGPTLSVNAPTNNWTDADGTQGYRHEDPGNPNGVTFSGHADDGGVGVAQVIVDGDSVDVSQDGSWTYTKHYPANPGQWHVITVRALDQLENYSQPQTKRVRVVTDYEDPTASISVSPEPVVIGEDLWVGTGDTVTVTAQDNVGLAGTQDNPPGIEVIQPPEPSGVRYVENADGSQTLDLVHNVTSHGVSVVYDFKVTDSSGNELQSVRKILKTDTTAPIVGFTSPTPSQVIKTQSGRISCSGTVSDVGVGVEYTAVKITAHNGVELEATVNSDGTWSVNDLPVEGDAHNSIQAVAIDAVGNRSTQARLSFYIETDVSGPVISLLRPSNNQFVRGVVEFEVKAIDERSWEPEHLTASGSALTFEVTTTDLRREHRGSGTINTTGMADGEYNFAVSATDAAGNGRTANYRLRVDNTGPTIRVDDSHVEIESCCRGQDTYNAELSGRVTDSGSGVGQLREGGNSVDFNTSGYWTYTKSLPLVLCGTYQAQFVAHDVLGNQSGTKTVSIEIRRFDPDEYDLLCNQP